jgi:hypothetical protein
MVHRQGEEIIRHLYIKKYTESLLSEQGMSTSISQYVKRITFEEQV